ncbi:MAG: hypothetical protein AABY32_05960 [Nanoarchaeota archaeon]
MKKGLIVLLLLGILLILPFVQAQTYSGFEKFTDNVKLFFSFGDNKVRMALEIREKEVNSAMENFKNGNEEDSSKSLKKAWKRLQFIQEKVSFNTAQEVKESSNEIRENITQEENLSEEFDVYVLEEEKTELTAEWIIEVNGKEGQNLGNEVVVNGSEGQDRINEIEIRIDEIDDEISNWVIENEIAGDEGTGGGLTLEVKTEVAEGDDGLKPEVKNYVAGDGTDKNEVVGDGDKNLANPDLYNPDARAPGDTLDETYDDEIVNSNGNCGEGVVCE